MRIAAVSDLHGHLGIAMPKCDVILIAGDIVPLYSSAEQWQSAREVEWLRTKFARALYRWRKESGAEAILVGAGNHDVCFADLEHSKNAQQAINDVPGCQALIPSLHGADPAPAVMFKGAYITFFPWTPTIQNRNWAFSLRRSSHAMNTACSAIAPSTDILVTHGPPMGMLDETSDRVRPHQGSAQLMHRLLEVSPALTLCGHIHEQRGKRIKYFDLMGRERRIANVSMCDRKYTIRGARVQTFDLE